MADDRPRRPLRRACLWALPLVAAAAAALGHAGVTNTAVLARMEAMSAIQDATKTLGAMAKGARAFEAEAARAAAARIARHAARTPGLFAAEERDPNDEARTAIWEEFDDFKRKSAALEAEARALAEGMATQADLRVGLGRLGAACKDCHADYRQ